MIDLRATNKKLQQRSRNIIRAMCGPSSPNSDNELDYILENCHGSVKLAVATILLQTSVQEAAKRLEEAHGVLAKGLKNKKTISPTLAETTNGVIEKFVLCVDGGGSKCAAVLLGPNGEESSGEAGECNV
jgi:N-acetylmuramic acid 6-phosphate etherase